MDEWMDGSVNDFHCKLFSAAGFLMSLSTVATVFNLLTYSAFSIKAAF